MFALRVSLKEIRKERRDEKTGKKIYTALGCP
jgi:hypothetical protein